jgi:hypothetical protein
VSFTVGEGSTDHPERLLVDDKLCFQRVSFLFGCGVAGECSCPDPLIICIPSTDIVLLPRRYGLSQRQSPMLICLAVRKGA